MAETNDFLTAAPSVGGEFELLEAGAYEGVCVGIVKREFKKFQSEETEPKFVFVFQVVDDDTKHYLRTLPMRNVINDKSNLFMFLNSWLGLSIEKCSEGIDLSKLVGMKAQVVVAESERDGKTYNTISNVLKAKKNSTVEFVKDDKAPAFLNKNVISAKWIDGLGFAEEVQKQVQAKITDSDLIQLAESQKILASAEKDPELPF